MTKSKNNQPVMIKVSEEILESFDEVVKSCRSTRSELLRQVIELFLERYNTNIALEEYSSQNLPTHGDHNNNKLKQQ